MLKKRLLAENSAEDGVIQEINKQAVAINKRVDKLTDEKMMPLADLYNSLVFLQNALNNHISFYKKPKGGIFDTRFWAGDKACLEQVEKTASQLNEKLRLIQKQPSISQLLLEAKAEQVKLTKESIAHDELVRALSMTIESRQLTLKASEAKAALAVREINAKDLLNCLETYKAGIEIENPLYAKHINELAGDLTENIVKVFLNEKSVVDAKKSGP